MGVVLLQPPYLESQRDTVSAAQQLLATVLKPNGGVGLIYILQRPGRDYSVCIAGEPRSSAIEAVFMSGMCDVMKGDLDLIIRRGTPGFPPRSS